MPSPASLLLGAKDHHEALLRLFAAKKASNRQFSLEVLCRQAGIPSKGNVSDVMRGKRDLKAEYAAPVAKALALEGNEARYFALLVQRDRETKAEKRAKLEKSLASLAKRIEVSWLKWKGAHDLRAIAKTFCALFLFERPPTAAKLGALMPELNSGALGSALEFLVAEGFVERNESGFRPVARQFMVEGGDAKAMHIEFMRASLEEAKAAAAERFADKDALFESSVISVKKSEFLAALPKLRDQVEKFQSDLETETADELVYFNIQVYAGGRKPKG